MANALRGLSRIGWPRIVLAALCALCLSLLGLSLVPYSVARSALDALSRDHDAAFYDAAFAAQLAARLRVCALLVTLTVANLVVARRLVGEQWTALASTLGRSARATLADLRGYLASESKATLAALAVMTIAGASLRLAYITQPIRCDEAVVFVNYLKRPLSVTLTEYTPGNHLLFTLLMRLSNAVFGDEPWALRVPALVLGTLLIPATFAMARYVFGRGTALLAAALVASSSLLIEYSVIARGYGLHALLTVLALLALAYFLRAENLFGGACFAAAVAIGFLTIPTTIYSLALLAVWVLFQYVAGLVRPGAKRLLAGVYFFLSLGGVLVLCCYLPAILAGGLESIVANRFVAPLPWSEFIISLPSSLPEVWALWHRDLPTAVAVPVVLGALIAAVASCRVGAASFALPIAAVVGILPVVSLQRVVPYPRVWLFLLPVYLAFASYGLATGLSVLGRRSARLRPQVAAGAAVALALGCSVVVLARGSVVVSTQTGAMWNGDEIARFLLPFAAKDEKILAAVPSDWILRYYFFRRGLPTKFKITEPLGAAPSVLVVVNTQAGQALSDVLRQTNASELERYPAREIRAFPSATVYQIDEPSGDPDDRR